MAKLVSLGKMKKLSLLCPNSISNKHVYRAKQARFIGLAAKAADRPVIYDGFMNGVKINRPF